MLDGRSSALQICQILTLMIEVIGNILFYACIYRRTKDRLLSLCGTVIFFSVIGDILPAGELFLTNGE